MPAPVIVAAAVETASGGLDGTPRRAWVWVCQAGAVAAVAAVASISRQASRQAGRVGGGDKGQEGSEQRARVRVSFI